MDIQIRKTNPEDINEFMEMCHRVYLDAYVNPKFGATSDLFSKEIFFSNDTQQYFTDLLTQSDTNISYVALVDERIIGGITISKHDSFFMISGYYVDKEYQGQGVGSQLWKLVNATCGDSPLRLEVYVHAFRAINIYIAKGFTIDEAEPFKESHWPEWPEGTFLMSYRMTKNTLNTMPQATKDKETQSSAKLYADGGSRGNPGPSAGGFVLFDSNDNIIEESGKYLGLTTNNQAEYHSLKGGMEAAVRLGIRSLDVYMDSLLVVNQMKGVYKIRNRDLWPIHHAIKELLPKFESVHFHHIPRELNKHADSLVNKTLDERL